MSFNWEYTIYLFQGSVTTYFIQGLWYKTRQEPHCNIYGRWSLPNIEIESSFPVIHEIWNVGIFVLLKFENMLNGQINYFNFNSEHHDKCKFSLKLFGLLTVSNLFSLKVVQKCQHCQLCVLCKNSSHEVTPML